MSRAGENGMARVGALERCQGPAKPL